MNDPIPELSDSEIPIEIRKGCTTPMNGLLRALLFVLGMLVLHVTSYIVRGYLTSTFHLPSNIAEIIRFLSFWSTVFMGGPRLWAYMREHLRMCSWYNKFLKYYKEEMMQKGMTSSQDHKNMAIRDAMEKVNTERERMRFHSTRNNVGFRHRLNDNTSFFVSF